MTTIITDNQRISGHSVTLNFPKINVNKASMPFKPLLYHNTDMPNGVKMAHGRS